MGLEARKILVGIPALNEEANIETCLRSLVDGEETMNEVRIVVADGGSRDGTRAVVRGLAREIPNLRLIDNPDRLQAAALNRIVAEAAQPDHEVLVRCDAHAVYPPGYVRRVVQALERRCAASVVVPMDACGEGCFARAAAWVVDTPLGNGGSTHRGGRRSGFVDHGHHAGMRLEWFRGVGGYDPTFSHNEDAELDHRLVEAGGRIWLEGDARLGYRMRETPRGLALQQLALRPRPGRTLGKHRMRPKLRQLMPVWNVAFLAGCLLLGAVAPAFLLGPAAYLGALVVTSLVAMACMRSPCGILAGPALALMHLPWGAGFVAEMASALVSPGCRAIGFDPWERGAAQASAGRMEPGLMGPRGQ